MHMCFLGSFILSQLRWPTKYMIYNYIFCTDDGEFNSHPQSPKFVCEKIDQDFYFTNVGWYSLYYLWNYVPIKGFQEFS